MRLAFSQGKIPRSTTREQWLAMWRWKRITERELRKHEDEMLDLLREQTTNLSIFGNTESEHVAKMRRDLIDRIVNPPLLIPEWGMR